MRVPLIRFGSDDRPVEPWEERFAPLMPVVVAAILMLAMVTTLFAVTLWFLAGLLPSRMRERCRSGLAEALANGRAVPPTDQQSR